MKQFPFKAKFESFARLLINKERDEFLATASLNNLKTIIPTNLYNKEDIVAFSGAGFVTNLLNHNKDGIFSADAVKIYKDFIHRFVDYKHRQNLPFGTITNSGLYKYDINYKLGAVGEQVDEEYVNKNPDEPIVVGFSGVLWRLVNPELVSEIEESGDPESEKYLSFSLSFEIIFDEVKIARNSNILSKAEIITDEKEVQRLMPQLKTSGGNGVDSQNGNKPIGRIISGNIIASGFGIVPVPGGLVRGLITAEEISKTPKESVIIPVIVTSDNKISKNEEKSVKRDNNMKFNTLADLKNCKDEQVAKADVIDVLEKGIEDADKTWKKQLTEKEDALKTATKTADEAKASTLKLENDLKEVAKKLETAEAAQKATANEQRFQTRMASINEQFELDDKQSAAVASDIKDLEDDKFKSWLGRFELFAAKKVAKPAKKDKPDTDDGETDDDNDKEDKDEAKKAKAKKDKANKAKAELEDEVANAQKILDNAKAKLTKDLATAKDIEDEQNDYKKDFAYGDGIILTK